MTPRHASRVTVTPCHGVLFLTLLRENCRARFSRRIRGRGSDVAASSAGERAAPDRRHMFIITTKQYILVPGSMSRAVQMLIFVAFFIVVFIVSFNSTLSLVVVFHTSSGSRRERSSRTWISVSRCRGI